MSLRQVSWACHGSTRAHSHGERWAPGTAGYVLNREGSRVAQPKGRLALAQALRPARSSFGEVGSLGTLASRALVVRLGWHAVGSRCYLIGGKRHNGRTRCPGLWV